MYLKKKIRPGGMRDNKHFSSTYRTAYLPDN